MFYLVTGPEKSGKSARAEALAVSLGEKRIYLATMVPFGDWEMSERSISS